MYITIDIWDIYRTIHIISSSILTAMAINIICMLPKIKFHYIYYIGYLDTNCIWYQAGSIVVPITANVTTANIPDNQIYLEITSLCLHPETIKKTHYMVADPGYDAIHSMN
jgi:hypothetical protein